MCIPKLSRRIWFGIALTALGLVITALLIIFFGSTPIIGPVFISVGIGVYFLGLNVAVTGGIAKIEKEETPSIEVKRESTPVLLNIKSSSIWNPFIIFLIILVCVTGLVIIATVSSNSPYTSQIAGPAIGGVIAAFAGIIFTGWRDNQKEERRKQFLGKVFLSELRKIQGFIAGIETLNIKSDDFLITRPPITDEGGLIRADPRPEYDEYKRRALLSYFQDNSVIRVTETSPLVSNKNPFEVFAQEIYSFGNSNLIYSLFGVDSMMNEANSHLLNFYQVWENEDGHMHLFYALRKIERVKPVIDQILSERELDSISGS